MMFDESTCDRCGRHNPVWYTPAEVWQAVYGKGGQPSRQGVLCPSCFIDDAEAAGVTAPHGTPGWLVTPEGQRPAPLDRNTCASCRFWDDITDEWDLPHIELTDDDGSPDGRALMPGRWGYCTKVDELSPSSTTSQFYVTDGSDYRATLYTRETFGCNQWEPGGA